MRVHQVLAAAAPRDAVTHHALAVQRALAGHGESAVFAAHVHPDLAGAVHVLGDLSSRRGDALVVHVSIGEEALVETVLARPEPVVVVHHNVSPPEYFERYDPDFARRLRDGRDALVRLRDRAVLAVADSEFNAEELRALGFEPVEVVPVAVDFDRLLTAPRGAATEARLSADGRPVVVFVGQLLPHKRPDFLLQAFAVLRTYLALEAVVVLVGARRLPGYAAALDQLVAQLALPGVWAPGEVSDGALAALLRHADVFATASEHEGFCVPVLEAMAFDVPVVARAFGAVPGTVGDAGLVLCPTDGPAVMAEAILAAATEASVRDPLLEAGRRRVERFRASDPAAALADRVVAVAVAG